MKKLILLLFIPLVFACNNDDDDIPNMCVDESLINLDYAALKNISLYVDVTETHMEIAVRLLILRSYRTDGPCN